VVRLIFIALSTGLLPGPPARAPGSVGRALLAGPAATQPGSLRKAFRARLGVG
jgi:hypothetical protein